MRSLSTSRVLASSCLLATLSQVDAFSKKIGPLKIGGEQHVPEVGQTCDLTIPGVWTGFEGSTPLYDSYQLTWRGGLFPSGSFSAVFITGSGWTLGLGEFSSDNTTAMISFDSGVNLNGNVSGECSTIMWDNGSSWRKTVDLPKRVHMLAMNHLDVGYNGIPTTGFINNVLNEYFITYFPRAVAMIQALKERNGTERLLYTTHPWLVDMYLNCPTLVLSNVTLACPSAADVQAFKSALQSGDIVFHAAPFNIEYGAVYNDAMLDAIFREPARLADGLGVPRSKVASLRDVPGAPRSMIPSLVRNNISVLTIGVNGYAPRPQIETPCVWVDPNTNTSVVLLMTEQGQGYPNNAGPDPLNPGGLAASFCVEHPASAAVLCWAFRTDNSGPPVSVEEVLNQYDIARWQWPGAEVIASTFDNWWAEFQDAVPSLPINTQEQGETWMTGCAADPPKQSFYRAAAREYSACLAAGTCDPEDPRLIAFTRFLMKLPEHTDGLPSIYDNANYTNVQFQAARAAGVATYVNSEASWIEQRQLGTIYAMEALGDHPLAAQITAAIADLVPTVPNPAGNGYSTLTTPSTVISVTLPGAGGGTVKIGLDGASGALATLTVNGVVLADATHMLGQLEYETVNDTTIDAQHITLPDGNSCCCCYGWDKMQAIANPQETRTFASVVAAWTSQPVGTSSPTAPFSLLAQLTFPSYLNVMYGAPASSWVNYTVNADGTVDISLQMFNKTSTRLGEAIYFRFATPPVANSSWFADVLHHWTDPLDVVIRGSQHQHGIAEGVVYVSGVDGSGLDVTCYDTPVMSPWTATDEPMTVIVPFDPLVGPVLGFASVNYGNIYNTNYNLYSIDDSYKFRYKLSVLPPSEERAARFQRASKKQA